MVITKATTTTAILAVVGVGVLPLSVLTLTLMPIPTANAYWGGGLGGGWWNGQGWTGTGYPPAGSGAYDNDYNAGITDAVYDHDNNLAYNPEGQCLSCHHGYNTQWNSYQAQESTQGTSINIYGNNNYVNTNQYSGQNQQRPDFNPPNCWGSNCDGP